MWIEQGIKWACSVKESKNVVKQSKPSTIDKPVMKSMLTICHGVWRRAEGEVSQMV
jgi:hypothetical protein